MDFSKNLVRFDESNYTIGCRGSYKILDDAKYYNCDGSYAGTLHAGDRVYAKASNTYFINMTTYRMEEGKLNIIEPECGKNVYQVVINDADYYMSPKDLYGSYMGGGMDWQADNDETEAHCIAEGLTSYSHGDIWYYDSEGNHQSQHVYDVNKDGCWYFVSMFNGSRITDNYLTYRIPWGEIWARFEQDLPAFKETDKKTGHEYVWKADTFCFLDLDFDGICEYEVKLDEWQKWQDLN